MKLPHRRRFLHLAAGAAALPVASRFANAQSYPSRPVRLIVPWPAGGVVDLYARLISQLLSERMGQQFIVENRVGAGGNLGTEAVVRAPADGHTLLQLSSANAWAAALYDNLTFNFLVDLTPIASIYTAPALLVAHPSFAAASVPELIAYAKRYPGKVNMASAGVGSAHHVYGELFKSMAGIDMFHVPYRGGAPAMTDLLAGHVHLTFEPAATAIEHVRSGRLRPLAVTSLKRLEVLPSVPTVSEFLPGYEGIGWQGLAAPKNTPSAIIEKLNKEVNAGLSDDRIKARIADLAGTVFVGSPSDFGTFITAYTEKWAKVIRAANIKPD
jgi:tripartite-type tricarboxylate transporter receptor subunit TctC